MEDTSITMSTIRAVLKESEKLGYNNELSQTIHISRFRLSDLLDDAEAEPNEIAAILSFWEKKQAEAHELQAWIEHGAPRKSGRSKKRT